MEMADCLTFVCSSRNSEHGGCTFAPAALDGSGAPVRCLLQAPAASRLPLTARCCVACFGVSLPHRTELPEGCAQHGSQPKDSLWLAHVPVTLIREHVSHGAIHKGCCEPRCHVTVGASFTPLKLSSECTMDTYSLRTLGTEPLSMPLQRREVAKGPDSPERPRCFASLGAGYHGTIRSIHLSSTRPSLCISGPRSGNLC